MAQQPLQIWGDGNIVRDYYISDVIQAISVLMYTGMEKVFNIGSGHGLSLNNLISLIEEEIGHSVHVSYQESRKFDVPANVLSITKAAMHLNWYPTVSIKIGLSRFVQYLKSISE